MKIPVLILIQIIFFSCLYFLDITSLNFIVAATIYSVSAIYLILDTFFNISIMRILKSNVFFIMCMVFTTISFIATLITLLLYLFSNTTIDCFIFNLVIFIISFIITIVSGLLKSK